MKDDSKENGIDEKALGEMECAVRTARERAEKEINEFMEMPPDNDLPDILEDGIPPFPGMGAMGIYRSLDEFLSGAKPDSDRDLGRAVKKFISGLSNEDRERLAEEIGGKASAREKEKFIFDLLLGAASDYLRRDRLFKSMDIPAGLVFEDGFVPADDVKAASAGMCRIGDYLGRCGLLTAGGRPLWRITLKKGVRGSIYARLEEELEETRPQDVVLNSVCSLRVEIARAVLPVDDLSGLRDGSIIQFDRFAGATIDLFIEEYEVLAARGEAVVIGENLGIRVTDCLFTQDMLRLRRAQVGAVRPRGIGAGEARLVLGRARMNVQDLLGMGAGSIIELDALAGFPSSLEITDGIRLEAEIIVIDEKFGARIVTRDSKRMNPDPASVYPGEKGAEIGTGKAAGDEVAGLSSARRPFDNVRSADPDVLCGLFAGEHPQTAALVLSCLDPGQAALVLAGMSSDLQAEVTKRIACMTSVSLDVVRAVERGLERKLLSMKDSERLSTGGPDTASEIMKRVVLQSERKG